MARIRTIKPEFWTSEQVADCSPTARLLFIGLWTFSDDAGRHVASYKRAKMEVFPADSISIKPLVAELIAAGLLIEYEAEGQAYWQVTGWHHQKIEKPHVKYPAPTITDQSPTVRRPVDDQSPPGMEWNGMESTGKEKEPPISPPRGTRVPVTYPPAFEKFWQAYPRRIGKGKAFKQWRLAVKGLNFRSPEERNHRVSEDFLWDAAVEFAGSLAGKRGEFVPHPATWLYQARYDDDRAEWNRPETNGTAKPEQPALDLRRFVDERS